MTEVGDERGRVVVIGAGGRLRAIEATRTGVRCAVISGRCSDGRGRHLAANMSIGAGFVSTGRCASATPLRRRRFLNRGGWPRAAPRPQTGLGAGDLGALNHPGMESPTELRRHGTPPLSRDRKRRRSLNEDRLLQRGQAATGISVPGTKIFRVHGLDRQDAATGCRMASALRRESGRFLRPGGPGKWCWPPAIHRREVLRVTPPTPGVPGSLSLAMAL